MSELALLNPGSGYSIPWADLLLLFAGLSVIVAALLSSQRLGNRPVHFGFTRLGVDLKADRLTFVLMVGLMLIAVGVFFRYRNYEAELNKLQVQVEGFKPIQEEYNRNLDSLRIELRQFKVYDLGLKIVFPDVPGQEVEKYFEIQVLTQKQPEAFTLSNYKPVTNFGDTYVNLNNLSRGERVKIIAVDKRNSTKWESVNDILIPETEIQMKKKP